MIGAHYSNCVSTGMSYLCFCSFTEGLDVLIPLQEFELLSNFWLNDLYKGQRAWSVEWNEHRRCVILRVSFKIHRSPGKETLWLWTLINILLI